MLPWSGLGKMTGHLPLNCHTAGSQMQSSIQLKLASRFKFPVSTEKKRRSCGGEAEREETRIRAGFPRVSCLPWSLCLPNPLSTSVILGHPLPRPTSHLPSSELLSPQVSGNGRTSVHIIWSHRL